MAAVPPARSPTSPGPDIAGPRYCGSRCHRLRARRFSPPGRPRRARPRPGPAVGPPGPVPRPESSAPGTDLVDRPSRIGPVGRGKIQIGPADQFAPAGGVGSLLGLDPRAADAAIPEDARHLNVHRPSLSQTLALALPLGDQCRPGPSAGWFRTLLNSASSRRPGSRPGPEGQAGKLPRRLETPATGHPPVMAVLRAVARPMLASIFIAQGFDTLLHPERVVPAAEPVVRPVAGRVPAVPDRVDRRCASTARSSWWPGRCWLWAAGRGCRP